MKNQVEDKRHKFAAEIRRKQHSKYFEINRKWQDGTLSALAFLSILLEDQMYQQIQMVLDQITLNSEHTTCTQQTKQTIINRYQNHSDQSIRLLMLRLLNRIGEWETEHVKEAGDLYVQGHQDMIKELALYLDRLSRKDQVKWKEILNIVFQLVFKKPVKDRENIVFWLDIVCQGVNSQNCLKPEHINELLLILQGGILAGEQYQISKIIEMANKIVSYPQVSYRFVQMPHFHNILQMLEDCTIDILIQGLQMIAQLLSADDKTIQFIMNHSNTLKILQMYSDHTLSNVKTNCFWAISNIAGSEQWQKLFQMPQPLMNKLVTQLGRKQCHPNTQSQIFFCYLNLLCNADQTHLMEILTNYNGRDALLAIFEQVMSPFSRNLYMDRLMFAIFSIAKKCPTAVAQLESIGVRNMMQSLYQQQKNPQSITMIQSVFDALDQH